MSPSWSPLSPQTKSSCYGQVVEEEESGYVIRQLWAIAWDC